MKINNMALSTLHVEAFDVLGDPNTTSQRWKQWVSRFELIVLAAAVSDDKQKRALLLHCAGPDVQDIFGTLSETGLTYDVALAKLNQHFTLLVNVPYTRHLFRKLVQNDGETVLQFVTRLRMIAVDCEFGEDVNGFIRDQVIEKCRHKSLRVRFLSETGITLTKLLEMSQAFESSHRHASEIEQGATASASNVNFTSHKKNKLHVSNVAK